VHQKQQPKVNSQNRRNTKEEQKNKRNFSPLLVAKLLGAISPKVRSKNDMIPTAIASPDSPKRIMQVSVAIAEAAIFTILFQIKIEIITDFLSDLSREI
jgi:hypothetical protein